MKTRDRALLLFAGAALLVSGALLWPRPPSLATPAGVARLRRGMDVLQAIEALEPGRSTEKLELKYHTVMTAGAPERDLALDRAMEGGRTLVTRWRNKPGGTSELSGWSVRPGAPRPEGFNFGRSVRLGPWTVFY